MIGLNELESYEGRKVLLTPIRPNGIQWLQELEIAIHLLKFDAYVTIVICDACLSHDDMNTRLVGQSTDLEFISPSLGLKRYALQAFGLIHPRLKIKVIDNLESCEYLSEEAFRSTLIRWNQSSNIASVKQQFPVTYERLSSHGKEMAWLAKKLFDEDKYDLHITSHGIYSTWAPFKLEARRRQIMSVVWGAVNYTGPRIRFSNGTYFNSRSDSTFQYFWERRLQFQENIDYEKFRLILDGRLENRGPDFDNYSIAEDGEKPSISSESVFEDAIVLFPNVIWDGNVPERDRIFDSIESWIFLTVQHIIQNTDATILVRAHPAEHRLLAWSVSLKDGICATYPEFRQLCEHPRVIFLESDSGVNSYQLAQKCKLAIVYDGNLAIELPLLNVRTIAAGGYRFSQDFWNVVPGNTAEYFASINSLISEDSFECDERTKERIYDYYYWYHGFLGCHSETYRHQQSGKNVPRILLLLLSGFLGSSKAKKDVAMKEILGRFVLDRCLSK